MDRLSVQHEGKLFHVVSRNYDEYHGITAAVIAMNEEENIVALINHLRPIVKRVVIVDGGSYDRTVKLAEPLADALSTVMFRGHYANQRNKSLELVTTDWVLVMDPDERLSDELYRRLPDLINQDEIDCYAFPRREFREGKEDKSVYPDYQRRLFRTYCRYVRPVHEELVGFKEEKVLPKDSGFDIIHTKPDGRHHLRNDSYHFFEANYSYELGCPGKQLKDTCRKISMDTLKEMVEVEDGKKK